MINKKQTKQEKAIEYWRKKIEEIHQREIDKWLIKLQKIEYSKLNKVKRK